MDVGMPFLLETTDLEDCAQLCTSLNLQFIEWNMNFPQCQLSSLAPEELNRLGKEYGLYFTLHLDENLNICDFNEKVRNAYLDTALDSIALAKQIKAPLINMHLHKGIYITLPDQRVYLFSEYCDFYYENIIRFRELCSRALEGSEILIAIENTDGFREHEKKAIELLLESSCFGLTLDIGHSHAVKDIDMPFYEKHRDRLVHMHVHDAKGTSPHLALADGEIDLQERLKLAEETGVRVVLETKTVDALKKSVQVLTNK